MSVARPLVSVVVPVYNVREYIVECIRSVLGQTYSNVECVCVDDGSDDGSAEILDDLANGDKRVVVVHQPNSGVSVARNEALRLAKGEYITFLDSDDMFAPDFIENAMIAFSNDEELDVWIGQVIKVDESNVEYPYAEQPQKSIPGVYHSPLREFLRMPGRQYLFSICPKVYNARVIKEYAISFRGGLLNGEDALFVTKVFSFARKIVIDERVCYRRRMRRGSLVGRSWADQVDDSLVSIIDLKEFALRSRHRADLCAYVAQRALARIRIVFDRGYTNEFLCDYIKTLFAHKLFRSAVCLPIMRWAPVRFRVSGILIWVMPKSLTCFLLCSVVKIRNRQR